MLLHGWPYDINSFAQAAPLLADRGHRVIVPSSEATGARVSCRVNETEPQQAAIAVDTIELMDALGIKQATIAGFDWGARTADIVAALWPERCRALVSVSGYLIGSQNAGRMPLPPSVELHGWYQYYFATDCGQDGYRKTRAISRGLSGISPPRVGISTTRRSRGAPPLSQIPTISIW